MKLTRAIGLVILLNGLVPGGVNAQTLRNAVPPAEFPPASYKGKQYVDSRGCIYIRAGIDGNVTWVPRVSRSRKQICGYKPTAVAGATTTAAPRAVGNPVTITATPPADSAPKPTATPKPSEKPAAAPPQNTTAAATVQARPVQARPVPDTVVAQPKPAATPRKARAKTTRRKPSPGPAPTVIASPDTGSKPAPKPVLSPAPRVAATRPAQSKPSPGPAPTVFTSRRPAQAPRVVNPAPVVAARVASSGLAPGTRVVPRHVYDNRQNTTNVSVPAGYVSVWDDGRLNPHRAERTLAAAQLRDVVSTPPGFRRVGRKDGRYNSRRGVVTAAGNAQSNQIWSSTVPRTLAPVPTRARVVVVPKGTAQTQVSQTQVARLSTRSTPADASAVAGSGSKRLYIRVAVYSAKADARATARALARNGLPMNLGRVESSGNKVVLAGPFPSDAAAKTALNTIRSAGFTDARLMR